MVTRVDYIFYFLKESYVNPIYQAGLDGCESTLVDDKMI